MEKEFIPYKQALALKELGFDEPCLFAWCNKGGWNKYECEKEPITQVLRTDGNPFGSFFKGKNWNREIFPNTKSDIQCSAPLYQQAFRWLYQKLDIEKDVMPLDTESQQLLLKELIDKMSSKHLLV